MSSLRIWGPLLAIISTIVGGIWNYLGATHVIEIEGQTIIEKKAASVEAMLKEKVASLEKKLQLTHEWFSWAPNVQVDYRDIDTRPVRPAATTEDVMNMARRVQHIAKGWFGDLDLGNFTLEHFNSETSEDGIQFYLIEIAGTHEYEINEPVVTIRVTSSNPNDPTLERKVTVTPVFLALPANKTSSHKTLTRIWISECVVRHSPEDHLTL